VPLFRPKALINIKAGQTVKPFSCGFLLSQFHDHFGVLFLPDGPCPAAVNTATPDFDKTVRQDVQAKPSQELHPVQCYRFLSGPVPVIFMHEGHVVVIQLDDALIGDGRPVCVLQLVSLQCFSLS